MKNSKRLFIYLLLNIAVSAGTMWVVFNIGIRKFPDLNIVVPTPVFVESTSAVNDDTVAPVANSVMPGQLEINLVLGTGDLASERILIKHIGDQEINMTGWKIIEEDGETYTFPGLSLSNGATVSVHSRVGALTVIDLFWGQTEAVWSIGELVKLVDPSGLVHAQYSIP